MDQTRDVSDLTALIAQRVRELRTGRGWSAERLAEEMTQRAGVDWQRMVVVKLETGRRQELSVRELLALAYVFDVAPVHLLIPTDDDSDPYPVTPKVTVRRGPARAWIRGLRPLPSTDERRYFAEVPRKLCAAFRVDEPRRDAATIRRP